ncbi:MAG: hypothetical protein GF353_14090 [Candidatus Lokiarchaeota archaeon]|nr:hypothetical protein [Candidatus Lokiarchaeota archaeon]
MSHNLMEELMEFLQTAELSNYEIKAYLSLVKSSKALTARDISSKSEVPSGRIYETLEDLYRKGMIDIIDSRPKRYRSFSLNRSFYNLISFQSKENNRKISYLFDKAKILEKNAYKEDSFIKTEPSRLFWSTAFGTQEIISLYIKYFSEAKEEMLFNDFINENTLKVLNFAHQLYNPIKDALDRGLKAKFLWSFEHDKRPLTEIQKNYNAKLFQKVMEKHEELFGISSKNYEVKMKYIHRRMPIYYDLLDKKRIIFKLQNPIKGFQIYSCMNVLDPNLATELRKRFFNIWVFEALE